MRRRFAAVFAIAAVAVLALAVPAWGHVSVTPAEAAKGSATTLTFGVPNEKDNATTTKVQVNFPTASPIVDAAVEAIPGWSFVVAKTKISPPITTDEGSSLDEAVKSVTWTATDGKGIGAGQFQQFKVSVGLPADGDQLLFPTVQTYSDNTTVNWVQETPPGGPEPENPAPVVKLTAGADAGGGNVATPTLPKDIATTSDVDSAKTVGIIGIVLGALGLIVAIVALVRGRRKSAPSAT